MPTQNSARLGCAVVVPVLLLLTRCVAHRRATVRAAGLLDAQEGNEIQRQRDVDNRVDGEQEPKPRHQGKQERNHRCAEEADHDVALSPDHSRNVLRMWGAWLAGRTEAEAGLRSAGKGALAREAFS